MSNPETSMKESIISELNKQRAVQKELIARKNMLAEYIDMNRTEFDDVADRLSDINEKITTLRGKL